MKQSYCSPKCRSDFSNAARQERQRERPKRSAGRVRAVSEPKPEKRLPASPDAHRGGVATSDFIHTEEELEFVAAVAAYQKRTGKKFLAFSEFLAVARSLGYRKVT